MKQPIALTLLGIVLLAGLAGRFARASASGENYAAVQETAVEAFLQQRGWVAGERIPITSDFTYSARVFARKGCWEPLLVSVVGGGSDAGGLYRRAGTREWRFVRDGEESADPPSLRFMLDQTLANFISPGRRASPILAVSAPVKETGACLGPSPSEWRELGAPPA
ncbi:MAG: hypothetical protein JWN93_2455 [Hyphomicrobiales bacterium]|jgi:hypothetical protein|nr:hypothetical protein [Hyphomicrobiales bacterium]